MAVGKESGRRAPSRAAAAREVTRSTEALQKLRVEHERLARSRDRAIVRLHEQGASFQQIAALAGLTRGRVAQIIWRAREDAAEG